MYPFDGLFPQHIKIRGRGFKGYIELDAIPVEFPARLRILFNGVASPAAIRVNFLGKCQVAGPDIFGIGASARFRPVIVDGRCTGSDEDLRQQWRPRFIHRIGTGGHFPFGHGQIKIGRKRLGDDFGQCQPALNIVPFFVDNPGSRHVIKTWINIDGPCRSHIDSQFLGLGKDDRQGSRFLAKQNFLNIDGNLTSKLINSILLHCGGEHAGFQVIEFRHRKRGQFTFIQAFGQQGNLISGKTPQRSDHNRVGICRNPAERILGRADHRYQVHGHGMFIRQIAPQFSDGRHPFYISLIEEQRQTVKVEKAAKGNDSLVERSTEIDIEQVLDPAAGSVQWCLLRF